MEIVKTTTVARVNQIDIVLIENGEKRVPLKPICEAIGVDFSSQLQKVKEDEILGSVVVLSPTAGKDGKVYEMQTIPFKFVFGWIFGISAKNVKEEAREALIKYKLECYDALYNHFTRYAEFVELKQKKIEEQLVIEETAKTNFKSAREILYDTQTYLKSLRKLTFENFDPENHQFRLDF